MSGTDYITIVRNAAKRELRRQDPDLPRTSKIHGMIELFLAYRTTAGLPLSNLSASEKNLFFKMMDGLVRQGLVEAKEEEKDGKKVKYYNLLDTSKKKK